MNTFRPSKLQEVIGQKTTKECLQILINSAKKQEKSLPHILFNGPAGTGKTTLAYIIAKEFGVDIQITNGGNFRSLKHLLPVLSKITPFSILFIDEIHRIAPAVEEILYPVMEDFQITLTWEKSSFNLDLGKFTLIGATTDSGSLSKPLLDRFGVKLSLTTYSINELADLLVHNSPKLGLKLHYEAAAFIAKCSKGTPRIANHLLSWIGDYCFSKGHTFINVPVAMSALQMLQIDNKGFTLNDRKYLQVLKNAKFPLGIHTLCSLTNLSKDTIENQIEPFLLRQGLIVKTLKGRIICST